MKNHGPVARIAANVDAFYADTISYETFCRRARRLWRAIERNPRRAAAVRAAMRARF